MEKFSDLKYEHLLFEDLKETYKRFNSELKECKDAKSFRKKFDEINVFRSHYVTMRTLCSIRHSIDTSDEYYEKENDYFDEIMPQLQEYEDEFMSICLAFPERDALNIPKTFFMMAENKRKVFSPEIIADLQEENKLSSVYMKLNASAKIEFEGEIYNISSIKLKINDDDRDVRRRAYSALNDYFTTHEKEYDEAYDKLVKVRDRIAKKLGYSSFTEVGYLRMNRFDYGPQEVANYREEIVKKVVPFVNELHESQAERIGVDTLKCYDKDYCFKSGNPKPQGGEKELVAAALKMYTEMSEETAEYFDTMVKYELFDLPSRENKETGGYCTELNDYNVPFIFANFNGTSADVDVLTHEAGHGFQSYLSMKEIDVPDVIFPTYESCEIHSMSMEFFAYPWIDLFFGEDTEKYKYYHISSALTFLPYGCLVDHFQHEVYAHPEMTPEERKAAWRRLEKIYKPDTDYEGFDLLERGGYYFRQLHIFVGPFYYIDYTLAQVCALQFYARTLANDPATWKDYVHLCKLGGTLPFTELVKEAGLISPFEEGCLDDVITRMKDRLAEIDTVNM